MLIFNFSHPLSPQAISQLNDRLGNPRIEIIKIHLDLNAPVRPQIVDICRTAADEYGKPNYIILPGLAIAAVYTDRFFSKPEDDYPPCVTYTKLIRLVMEGMPPVWVVGDIEE